MMRRFVPLLAIGVLLAGVALPAALQAQTPPAMPDPEDEEEKKPKRKAMPEIRDDDTGAPPPPPPPKLLLTADMDCRVEIDGEEKAVLIKDQAQEVRVRPGEHLLQAFPTEIEEGPTWKDTIKVPDTGQVVALIELADLVAEWREQRKAQETEGRFVSGDGIIADNESGLTWMSSSVTDLKWPEASSFCQKKQLGGLSGWRLPTVQELSTLYWPDHPDPRHEAQEGDVTKKFWGMVKTKGPMEVEPVLIHRPFEELPRLSRIWVSDERVACSFLGELNCSGGEKRGDALCVSARR